MSLLNVEIQVCISDVIIQGYFFKHIYQYFTKYYSQLYKNVDITFIAYSYWSKVL